MIRSIDKLTLNCIFSGDVVCSKCQHVFSFSAIEKFFTKSRTTDLDRARELFLKSKPKTNFLTADAMQKGAVPVNEMSTNELLELFQHLGFQKIEPSVFQGVQAFCHAKRKSLYFPMQDVESNFVGYKKLSRLNDENPITETTFPEQNSFGAVIFPPIVKRGFRDHRTAILVLNLLDALALRMEKTNS